MIVVVLWEMVERDGPGIVLVEENGWDITEMAEVYIGLWWCGEWLMEMVLVLWETVKEDGSGLWVLVESEGYATLWDCSDIVKWVEGLFSVMLLVEEYS